MSPWAPIAAVPHVELGGRPVLYDLAVDGERVADRINSALGYTLENCRITSWGLNCLRGAHDDADLQEWLRATSLVGVA